MNEKSIMRRQLVLCVMFLALVAGMSVNQNVWAQGEVEPVIDEPEQVRIDDLFRETPPERAAEIIHPIPEVPVVVDGVQYEPQQISRFDKQPLYFILDERAEAEGVLYAFTKISDLRAYLRLEEVGFNGRPASERNERKPLMQPGDLRVTKIKYQPQAAKTRPSPASNCVDPSSALSFSSLFGEHCNYQGSQLFLQPGWGYPRLSRVRRGLFRNWNDVISSVSASHVGTWTALFEHDNYGGSALWVYRTQGVPCLSLYGWNDRASSLGVTL